MHFRRIRNLEQIIGQVDDEFDEIEAKENRSKSMGKYIVELPCDGVAYYLLWSSVVDAPVTYGMTMSEFEVFYADEYGWNGEWTSELRENFSQQMRRVAESGTSDAVCRDPVEQWLACNRAGDDESQLTFDEIVEKWVREPRKESTQRKQALEENPFRSRVNKDST